MKLLFQFLLLFLAGIVNIFVLRWSVAQGNSRAYNNRATNQIGYSFSKSIMGFSLWGSAYKYVTTLLGLPLLGITGLKKRNSPYTLYLFLIGCLIFVGGLLLF